jgi:hypothetical protein
MNIDVIAERPRQPTVPQANAAGSTYASIGLHQDHYIERRMPYRCQASDRSIPLRFRVPFA